MAIRVRHDIRFRHGVSSQGSIRLTVTVALNVVCYA